MTPDNAKVILDFLVSTLERETATTAKVLAAMPTGADNYKPSEKCMPALELCWHIASADHMFLSGISAGAFATGEPNRPESMSSGTVISNWYKEVIAQDLAKMKAMTPEDCARMIDFHGMWQMPAAAWAQLALTHGIHHRGQMSSYLRPMGGKVPSIYGPSADEPIGATQNA